MRKVEVVSHDPKWREAFEIESKSVADALGKNVVAVHHIGSTAIPSIYAKPVIDLLVEVKDIIRPIHKFRRCLYQYSGHFSGLSLKPAFYR